MAEAMNFTGCTLSQRFYHHTICSPTWWAVMGCIVVSVLNLAFVVFIHRRFKRDKVRMKFVISRIDQLAVKLRAQEPNPNLIENITKKLSDCYQEDNHFESLFNTNKPKPKPEAYQDFKKIVENQKNADDAKILLDAKLPDINEHRNSDEEMAKLKKVTFQVLQETRETIGSVMSKEKNVGSKEKNVASKEKHVVSKEKNSLHLEEPTKNRRSNSLNKQ